MEFGIKIASNGGGETDKVHCRVKRGGEAKEVLSSARVGALGANRLWCVLETPE